VFVRLSVLSCCVVITSLHFSKDNKYVFTCSYSITFSMYLYLWFPHVPLPIIFPCTSTYNFPMYLYISFSHVPLPTHFPCTSTYNFQSISIYTIPCIPLLQCSHVPLHTLFLCTSMPLLVRCPIYVHLTIDTIPYTSTYDIPMHINAFACPSV
jgi:hypothetical protein